MPSFRNRSFWLLLGILLIKAAIMASVIQFGGFDLAPDEAQYWTWSQSLDWGYYSKPPGIALEIWLGTKIFGNTVLGVRIGAVFLSIFISLSVYALALASGLTKRGAFWAGVVSALTPMGFFASYYATTDVGLVLFWTLACIPLAKALKENETPNYLLIGLFIAMGALFKWPIYLIWVLVFFGMISTTAFRKRSIVEGLLVSLLGLLPPLIWNATRGWPTFQHVWSTMRGGHSPKTGGPLLQGNFFDFFGAQAALLSPILFILLLVAFAILFRRKHLIPPAVRFFGYATFFILAVYQGFSLFQKMQGNWCVFVYPMAIVFLCWTLIDYLPHGRRWIRGGLAFSLLMVAAVFSLSAVQIKGAFPSRPIPQKFNRLNECLGWSGIGSGLIRAGYDPEKDFLFSDSYQGTSLLSFYAPRQKRAYFFNLKQRRQNQFTYWPSLADQQLGRSGFFVVLEEYPIRNRTENEAVVEFEDILKPYFKTVGYAGMVPLLHMYGKPRKVMLIYRCEEYNGAPCETVNLF